jgi:FolB domain-containing protein
MDQIFITDLRARGIIGVNEWERKIDQEILINIILQTDTIQAAVTDDLKYSIDYSSIAKRALTLAESAHRFTVEALANDIAKVCLEFKQVQTARVRVEKPGAVRFASSVGVEIERSREDQAG